MRRLLPLLVCLMIVPAVVWADEHDDDGKGWAGYDGGFRFESADGSFELKIDNRVQVRFTHEDPATGDSTDSFRIRRYKLKFEGKAFTHWKFKLQTNLAGGSVSGENDDLLEDALLIYAKKRQAQLWVGQGKAFFGRQFLTSSGKQQFVDRSIATGRFDAGRQIGVGLIGQSESKKFEYQVGLFNGEGINQTSNANDDFMYTGRVVFQPFGQYKAEESSLDYPDSSRLAIGVAGLMNTTGSVATMDETDISRYGVEAAYKIKGFNAVAEWFTETTEPMGLPDVDTDGFYVQLAYLFPNKKFEVAGRVSEISPDVVGPSADQSETGVAANWYFKKHKYKLQVDYRMIEFDADPADDEDEVRAQFQIQF